MRGTLSSMYVMTATDCGRARTGNPYLL
eukprot:SAG31_NODE_2780_length_5098_cov_2.124000_8_plen_27_part_01